LHLRSTELNSNAIKGNAVVENIRGDQKGFTLVELLVALTIFAIGLLSIAGMQVTALQANSSANSLSVAGSVAQGIVEDLLARDPNDPLFSVDVDDVDWDFDPGAAADTTFDIPGAGTYSATYSIDADNPVTNVARIDVKVTGGGRTVTLTSFKRSI
jgi:type IV pilus assembly protein PilV